MTAGASGSLERPDVDAGEVRGGTEGPVGGGLDARGGKDVAAGEAERFSDVVAFLSWREIASTRAFEAVLTSPLRLVAGLLSCRC